MNESMREEALLSYRMCSENVSNIRKDIQIYQDAIDILKKIIEVPYSPDKYTWPFKAAEKILVLIDGLGADAFKTQESIVNFYKSIIIHIYKLPIENYKESSVTSIVKVLEYAKSKLIEYANNAHKVGTSTKV